MSHVWLKFVKKADDVIVILFYDVIIVFMTGDTLKFQRTQSSSDQAQIWFGGIFWSPDFKFQLKEQIKRQVLPKKASFP